MTLGRTDNPQSAPNRNTASIVSQRRVAAFMAVAPRWRLRIGGDQRRAASKLHAESHLWKGTSRPVGVEEDAPWRASRCNQRETTWRDAIFEQPLSFAEHQRKDPDAIFVDEFGGDQRLQQFTAAPDMQRRPIRCLQPADLVHDITAYVQRVLPVELVEAARDDVLRRLVERLRDRVVALVRPVGGENLVGPPSQNHVELTGDSLVNGLLQGVVPEGRDP